MKIIIITDWFSEKMGYSTNFLPLALSALGHEVHLFTSTGQVYFNSLSYTDTFGSFLGPPVLKPGIKKIDGYTLHRLPFRRWGIGIYLKGLLKEIIKLKPDIIQYGEIKGPNILEIAWLKPFLGYRLFSECHVHTSVFRPAHNINNLKMRLFWWFYPIFFGSFIGKMVDSCFAISVDAAKIAYRFFGLPKKNIIIHPLGVATNIFKPIKNRAQQKIREQVRRKLGFSSKDIVCIYTGRISIGKKTLILAQAIDKLVQQGYHFKGLFIGNGLPTEKEGIRRSLGCLIHPYVEVHELPQFYWAADIGVWPSQESTSQLDAIACGLPIILSNRIQVKERVAGNGLLYKEGDIKDLMAKIKSLKSLEKRKKLGNYGAKKMKENYSWSKIAKDYERDYQKVLSKR